MLLSEGVELLEVGEAGLRGHHMKPAVEQHPPARGKLHEHAGAAHILAGAQG